MSFSLLLLIPQEQVMPVSSGPDNPYPLSALDICDSSGGRYDGTH
ncbi:hypothetical protein [Erythrobacter sp. KY5]|nr:hypothetical protein [Erythrobacter sp. KY5]